jgi:hypothetical protein
MCGLSRPFRLRKVALPASHNRISTKSSHKDLCQIMAGHREDSGLFRSVSQGPVQDHAKAPDNMSARSPQNLHTNSHKEWQKNLEQNLHARTPKSVIKGPAAAGVDLTDLDTRTSQEPLPQAPLWHLQAHARTS